MGKIMAAAIAGLLAAGLACGSSAGLAADIVLKAAHTNAVGEPQDEGLKHMQKRLEELTGGKATLQIFPNGQLGNEVQLIEGVLLGTVDVVVTANAPVTNFVPEMRIFDMPFIFGSLEHMNKAVSGPILQELQPAVSKKGLKLLGIYSSGIRHIMTKEPVNSMADLKGKKIRTMQNPVHLEAFKAFGANATALAYNELYGALQMGVVDGAEAANTNYSAQKFYEVAKNWAMVGWLHLTAPVQMSERRFAALPADIRKALEQAAADSAAFERQLVIDTDKPLLDNIKKQGVTITTPDPAPFRQAARQVYDKFLTSELDKKLLKLIDDAK